MARGRPSMGGYPKNTTFLSLLRNLGARSFDTRPRSPASIPDRSRSPGLLQNSAALERRGLLHHTALGWPDCSVSQSGPSGRMARDGSPEQTFLAASAPRSIPLGTISSAEQARLLCTCALRGANP